MVLFDGLLSYTVGWGIGPQSTIYDNKPVLLRRYSILRHIVLMIYVEIAYVHSVYKIYCTGLATVVIWLKKKKYETSQHMGNITMTIALSTNR